MSVKCQTWGSRVEGAMECFGGIVRKGEERTSAELGIYVDQIHVRHILSSQTLQVGWSVYLGRKISALSDGEGLS